MGQGKAAHCHADQKALSKPTWAQTTLPEKQWHGVEHKPVSK